MAKGIVYFIIATMGLLFGAAQPWIMSLYAVLMVLGFGVFMWQGRLAWRPGPWALGIVGFFLLVTLVQMVPISQGLLEGISPVRAEVLGSGRSLLGAGFSDLGSGWTISYSSYRSLARWGFIVCLGFFSGCVFVWGKTGRLTRKWFGL